MAFNAEVPAAPAAAPRNAQPSGPIGPRFVPTVPDAPRATMPHDYPRAAPFRGSPRVRRTASSAEAGGALEQRGDPVVDEPPQREGGVGALHAGDGEHLLGDPPEVVGVPGDHLHQEV